MNCRVSVRRARWEPGAVDRYADLDRPPLQVRALTAALAADGFDLVVLEEAASTNAELADRARAGAPEGTVVVAESQTAGRGRQGRSWQSPPRAGLTFSVLLRPPAVSGWLPLLAGLSVAVAIREQTGVDARVKWPNDVLVRAVDVAIDPATDEGLVTATDEGVVTGPADRFAAGRKVAGLLAEAPQGGSGAVVIGIGLNVTTRAAELPDEQATSLQLAGAHTTDRDTLLKAILRALARAYASWQADPAALFPAYRAACSTLGRRVRVELPGGEAYEGLATEIDDAGRLVVRGGGPLAVEERAFAAGDVIHLR
jgi:BirA family transcriptional regulator, biotin operon repressor / biotin---[acetyl-CoA-carboxylase] ligase